MPLTVVQPLDSTETFLVVFGFIGSILGGVGTALTAWNVIRKKETHRVNLYTLLLMIIGNACVFSYGMGLAIHGDHLFKNVPTWFFSGIFLFVNITVLCVWLNEKRLYHKKTHSWKLKDYDEKIAKMELEIKKQKAELEEIKSEKNKLLHPKHNKTKKTTKK